MQRLNISNLLKLVTSFVILFVLTLFNFTPIYADDTNLGRTPDGVFPLQENDVIMESEEITVDLEKNNVECVFVFHNTGNSKNVYMGFPGQLDGSNYENSNTVDLELRNFKTFIKGKELPVTLEKSIKEGTLKKLNQDYTEFFTFTVPFQANETITVRNTYDFTPTYDSIGNVYGGYVLETGAMWKGNIGSAKVKFKLGNIKPYQLEKLNPGGFRFEGNTLVWERNDFEPKYNLQVTYNNYRYTSEYLSNLTDDEDELKLEINQKIDSYNKVKELANKGQTDKLLSAYNKAVKEYNPILALYISSFLPSDKIKKEDTKIDNIEIQKMYDYYIAKCNFTGQEPANTQISISHLQNGKMVEDISEKGVTSYGLDTLKPGIEYNITFTFTDWLERSGKKTIKYRVPEQILDKNGTQSSDTSATASASSSPKKKASDKNKTQSSDASVTASASGSPENDVSVENSKQPSDTSVTASASGSSKSDVSDEKEDASNHLTTNGSNSPNKLKTEKQNGIDVRIIGGVLLSIILLGVAVATVIIMRKKEQD